MENRGQPPHTPEQDVNNIIRDIIRQIKAELGTAVFNSPLIGNVEEVQVLRELWALEEEDIRQSESIERYKALIDNYTERLFVADEEEHVNVVVEQHNVAVWRRIVEQLGVIERSAREIFGDTRQERAEPISRETIDRFVTVYEHADDDQKELLLRGGVGANNYVRWRVMAVGRALLQLPEEAQTVYDAMAEGAGQATRNGNMVYFAMFATAVAKTLEESEIPIMQAYIACTTQTRAERQAFSELYIRLKGIFHITDAPNPLFLPAWTMTRRKLAVSCLILLIKSTGPRAIGNMFDLMLLEDYDSTAEIFNTNLARMLVIFQNHKTRAVFTPIFAFAQALYSGFHIRAIIWNRNPLKIDDFNLGSRIIRGRLNLIMVSAQYTRGMRIGGEIDLNGGDDDDDLLKDLFGEDFNRPLIRNNPIGQFFGGGHGVGGGAGAGDGGQGSGAQGGGEMSGTKQSDEKSSAIKEQKPQEPEKLPQTAKKQTSAKEESGTKSHKQKVQETKQDKAFKDLQKITTQKEHKAAMLSNINIEIEKVKREREDAIKSKNYKQNDAAVRAMKGLEAEANKIKKEIATLTDKALKAYPKPLETTNEPMEPNKAESGVDLQVLKKNASFNLKPGELNPHS